MSQRIISNCLKFSLVAAFLLILQAGFTQSKKSSGPSLFPGLESAIELRKKDLGGDLMVFIASRDTVVYQKSFGDVNNRTQVPVGAASTWFTTALVLQLVDEGKISLDDKVTQYIPLYGSYFKNYITIRHCLTNTTGIKAEPFKTAAVHEKNRYASLEEEVNSYAKIDIAANAGELYRYNEMGTNIAARIVEIVTKKKFEQLMRQRLFTPLGMRNTTFASDDGSAPNPAFGAKSTAADLGRFLQMILANGTLAGKQILSEKALAEMRKIQVEPSRMSDTPKALAGFKQTLGAWAVEGGESLGANATALAYPGFTGVWPMVDFNRGYAFVLLPKNFTGEQNPNVYMGLKQLLDDEWKAGKR